MKPKTVLLSKMLSKFIFYGCILQCVLYGVSLAENVKAATHEVNPQAAINVNGQVKDQEGEALPGVNVLVKGSSVGTVTDMDGRYSLSVPSEADVLVFSSIGYATQEVPVNGRSVLAYRKTFRASMKL